MKDCLKCKIENRNAYQRIKGPPANFCKSLSPSLTLTLRLVITLMQLDTLSAELSWDRVSWPEGSALMLIIGPPTVTDGEFCSVSQTATLNPLMYCNTLILQLNPNTGFYLKKQNPSYTNTFCLKRKIINMGVRCTAAHLVTRFFLSFSVFNYSIEFWFLSVSEVNKTAVSL